MPDDKTTETVVTPPADVATTTVTPPPVAQAPASAPPEETGKKVEPPVVTPPVEKPVVEPPVVQPPVSKDEPVKLTLKNVKIPDGSLIPSEDVQEILSSSKTAEEAQREIDKAHKTIQKNVSKMDANNQKWLESLRNDPAIGGQDWEENKKLYVKTVTERFGENFAKIITALKIDGEPGFVKEVLRMAKLTQAKPLVAGEPIVAKTQTAKTPEQWADNYYKMSPNKNVAAKDRAPRW
jgi:hypothetical protein